jgi:hypothetical protein
MSVRSWGFRYGMTEPRSGNGVVIRDDAAATTSDAAPPTSLNVSHPLYDGGVDIWYR